ncbi:NAD(P)/FAD-dependent oxidoreductase [Kribbella sandramycini]|uniref:Cation diffusion facilitator CzcD-associated flavoprotein CzcO n=1 Tax=Kribbella sandramycini TaxID=60450 RepID=A0A7Y4P2M3_9ACTN|nr:NAD(P)/FAD-dependent oxidoreductase [Kribbella sandramycini]MBB6571544.1 cation diffusion facilitator CzcD-associated flavoprotein CzcO [Kribbella sandramycini]NOL44193.1 NAD(P)/FAD-dependent oxidoreductase [Kribbella sandramycini]
MTEVVIIGSGFAGLCMGIKLRQAGCDDFVILEKADRLGGTWRDNTYPGCACDIPSYLYSFSFEQNPHWTRMFAPWDEILAYLERCAEKYGVAGKIRYGAEATEAAFDERTGRWTVTVNGSETIETDALVTGVGSLQLPKLPEIQGLDSFTGTAFHSAQWDHSQDLTGRRVAVVGTGASAVQFIPKLAEQVGQLDVYQRNAPWITAKPDRAIGPLERRLHERFPAGQRAIRNAIYWGLEIRGAGFAGNPKLMKGLALQAKQHLRKQVPDPDLRARLTPRYDIGCKRLLVSNDYYPTFSRPNVDLVTTPISRITAAGVQTADGIERPADTIVFGTGFDVGANLTRMPILGKDGVDLADHWKREGVSAHLGMTAAGYPNLFFLVGPNTILGHSSMVFMIEAQVRYVLQALELRRRRGATYVEVRADAQRKFAGDVQDELRGSVWESGCTSWYHDAAGRNSVVWPEFTVSYWRKTRRLDPSDFVLVR